VALSFEVNAFFICIQLYTVKGGSWARKGVYFSPTSIEYGLSLMEIIRDANLPIEAACGGCCSCGTCPVHVDQEWFEKLEPAGDEEIPFLSFFTKHEIRDTTRLACQIIFAKELDGIQVTLSSYG
jgi:ferredoxin, 2Fe-2S